jgi:hypothetical protein
VLSFALDVIEKAWLPKEDPSNGHDRRLGPSAHMSSPDAHEGTYMSLIISRGTLRVADRCGGSRT